MNYHKCIKNNQSKCLGREKFLINGNVQCCVDEIADEYFIAQSVVDAIEDCNATNQSISRVCSRISYAADVITKSEDSDRHEVLPVLKRFALLVYENKERICSQKEMLELVCSFINGVKKWFNESLLRGGNLMTLANNSVESIKADLCTLEMALGVCVLAPAVEESLDDIFF